MIDTGLVSQTWYQDLAPKQKALFVHILCTCDVAGVFEVNYRMMTAYIGEPITEEDVFGAFGNRVIPLMGHESKGMLVDFVSFQCGGRLNPKVKVHQSILRRLNELGISVGQLQEWCTHPLEFDDGANAPEPEPEPERDEGAAAQEEEPTAVEQKPSRVAPVRAKETYDYMAAFTRFYAQYPRHDSKQAAIAKFTRILKECRTDEDRDRLLATMIESVRRQRQGEQWQKDGGRFIPMPSTWLNQRRWEDEGNVGAGRGNEESKCQFISELVSGMKV